MNYIRLVGSLSLSLVVMTGCGNCQDDRTQTQNDDFFEPFSPGKFELEREPRLRAPERIDFGILEEGERRTMIAVVMNDGRADLDISAWRVTNDAFTLDFPAFVGDAQPRLLQPGETVELAVSYSASSAAGVRGALEIESNDPKKSVTTIDLIANLALPCLEVEPSLDFGLVPSEGSKTLPLTLTSCSELAETVVRLDRTGLPRSPYFSVLDSGASAEIVLQPGESHEVLVEFTPPSPGDYTDELTFISNVDRGTEHVIELSGEGAPYTCPRAVIEAVGPNGQRVVADPDAQYLGLPLDNLSFSSARSYSPGGESIERVEWSLVRRPTDSGTNLGQRSDSLENTLFLDLTGEYAVELNVWNSRGIQSCKPARLDLVATPDEDIHIQLVWDTPNDPEQLDSLGTDVDLHLLRSGGIWNSSPWDCFWQNLEPDWGRRGDGSDDPSLDIDDVDGWGPENINLNNPEPGLDYHVGVHYFSDQGYGTSYATVRLYLGGQLVDEQRRRRMTDQQFWHVLDVSWPSREVTIQNAGYPTFPEGVFR